MNSQIRGSNPKACVIIQRAIKKYISLLASLPSFPYNKLLFTYGNINSFNKTEKCNNDANNKLRESIIGAIINQQVPSDYYCYSRRWLSMKTQIHKFIRKIHNENQNGIIEKIQCIHMGGRSANNDFKFIINDKHTYLVEFKFNVSSVTDCPQFVSLGTPSTYLDIPFESWFYDNYLPLIAKFNDGSDEGVMKIPDKDTYLKYVGNNEADCMATFKHLYKNNSKFNAHCKIIDKRSIKEFIQLSNLNIEKLSQKLIESQKDKHYMCYKDGTFYYDVVHSGLYTISNVVNKENMNIICRTISGHTLEVKLRFKNGCGLLFPAFQIKQRVPFIKELQNICKEKEIAPVPRLKKDILALLNEHGIVY
jgi:hypothetical protein